jgi:cation transport protein ChaC
MSVPTQSSAQFDNQDLWVFAYGSLIWNPGFEFVERASARLVGEHRALCIYSMVYRGTPEKPGLVLGLAPGGACNGVAFRVKTDHRGGVIAYLREREQVTNVYREVIRTIRLDRDGARSVRALTYVADRAHAQYAGRLTLDQQLHLVRHGCGSAGPNADYVVSTARALDAHGIRDRQLHRLAELLR